MTAIDRRKQVRNVCEMPVQVRFSGEAEVLEATVADICLGGCYISTISPPPEGTTVLLCFNGDGPGAAIAGRTVTCMPGSGMGIEFTGSMDGESADRLKSMIDRLEGGLAHAAQVVI
jgi:PilZ domain